MCPLMESDLQSTSHFQDGGHYVISRRKVLPAKAAIGRQHFSVWSDVMPVPDL